MSSSHVPDAAPTSGNVPGPNLMTHASSTSMVAANENDAATFGFNVDNGASSMYGSNGNIANPHGMGSSLSIASAAAAVALVGFDWIHPRTWILR